MKTWMQLAMVGLFVGSLAAAGCEKKEETAGQKLDKAINATSSAASDAAKKTEDAAKSAADALKK